jgi:hypothetical protein
MQLYRLVIPSEGMAAATTLDPHFDRRLEVVTAGLAREFCSKLQNKITREGRFNSYRLYDIIKCRG